MKINEKEKAEGSISEEVEEIIKRLHSKGSEKIKLYFAELINTGYLQERCKWIRSKNYIPENGYLSPIPDGAKDWKFSQVIPKEWLNSHTETNRFKSPKAYAYIDKHCDVCLKLKIDIDELCDELGLYDFIWQSIIQNYIFYNKLPNVSHLDNEIFSLFQIDDVIQDREYIEHLYKDRSKKGRNFLNSLLEEMKSRDRCFPVVIRISPYASERDIIDYVKRNYMFIKSLQQQHITPNILIGKVRSKNPKIVERNRFIYKNRHLHLKEIRQLLANNFKEFLDDGHIGKIISLERKKRK